jgi:DNA-binding PadR family transcriptional regulator
MTVADHDPAEARARIPTRTPVRPLFEIPQESSPGCARAFVDFAHRSTEAGGPGSFSRPGSLSQPLAPAISPYDAGMKAFLAGAIQMHVLHHAAELEIHGAWMTAELARHGHKVSPGTLYPALHRMEAAGLLTGREALVNSRRVRYYTITDAGRGELQAGRETLRQLADELLPSTREPRPRKASR